MRADFSFRDSGALPIACGRAGASAVKAMVPVRNQFGLALLVLPILIPMGLVEGWLDARVAFRVPRHGPCDYTNHSGTVCSNQREAPGLQGCGPDQEIRPYCWLALDSPQTRPCTVRTGG